MELSERAQPSLRIVVLGLSITSSWGNGHATTYRSLLRALSELGHDVLFLERDLPWYAQNRDMPAPPFARVGLYASPAELKQRYVEQIRAADLVIVGSYVPDGVELGQFVHANARGVTAFYDIDTPVTLAALAEGQERYISKALIPRYALYLSFTSGPVLEQLEKQYGSPCARALYCSVDPALYYPEPQTPSWDLGYMGTYSSDRQPALDALLLEPARAWAQGRFAVVGPQYPETIAWPKNTQRIAHLSPEHHRAFYNRQRFTLNVTREAMRRAGHAPSVRLFEAAACGTALLSDAWPGIEELFEPEEEIVIVRSTQDVLGCLRELPARDARRLGQRARERALARHTNKHRALELLGYVRAVQTGAV